MKKTAVRLLMLAAVCTVALWPPAVSHAWEACTGESCPFWRDVCERNTGHFEQTTIGYCIDDNNNAVLLWHAECTYTWRGPWTVDCTGI
jgi:hypothetical protein